MIPWSLNLLLLQEGHSNVIRLQRSGIDTIKYQSLITDGRNKLSKAVNLHVQFACV